MGSARHTEKCMGMNKDKLNGYLISGLLLVRIHVTY